MGEQEKHLLDAYHAGTVTRREFIRQALALTGGPAAAGPLLQAAGIDMAEAQQVDPNAPDLESGTVRFPGPAGPVSAYQSRSKAPGRYPGIVIVHENRGLSPHVQDVARRLARAGYHAVAPDFLSRLGGTANVPDASKGLGNIRELVPRDVVRDDAGAAVSYLKGLSGVRGDRLAITGFCWGGEMAFYLATQIRGLKGAVVFYGRTPKPLDLLREIEAPVLAHYGEEDKGITDGVPETEEAMRRYGKVYTYKIYPKAKHAFHNDTNPDRYNPEAAREAWERTLAFFKQHLTV